MNNPNKIDQMKKPTSFLNQNILDFSQGFMTDHDIYYLMKAVQDIKGIATMKILPNGIKNATIKFIYYIDLFSFFF